MVSEVALSVAQKVPSAKNQDSPSFASINSQADKTRLFGSNTVGVRRQASPVPCKDVTGVAARTFQKFTAEHKQAFLH